MPLPDSNISVAMVKSELGAATNDVGRLCIHPNINKWSKWKPVRHASKGNITEADLKNINYGFSIPSAENADEVILSQEWEYIKPIGGASSPYRLGDFRNYSNLSVIPISLALPDEIRIGQTGGVIRLSIDNSDVNAVPVFDILKDKFFGVYIKRGGWVSYISSKSKITSTGSILSKALVSNVPNISNSIGEFEMYAFFSDVAIPNHTETPLAFLSSLNAESNIAYKLVEVKQALVTTYKMAVLIEGGNEARKILFRNTPIYDGATISQDAIFTQNLIGYHYLTGVRVQAKRNSDGVEVHNQIYTGGFPSPIALEQESFPSGTQTIFSSPVYISDYELPDLGGEDFYEFTYTLIYS